MRNILGAGASGSMSLFWFARIVLKSIHAMFAHCTQVYTCHVHAHVRGACKSSDVRLAVWRTLHIAPLAVSSHRTCCSRVRTNVCRAHFFLYSPYLPFITVVFRHHLAALHAAIAATFEIDRRTTACPRSIAVLPLAPAAQLQHLLYGPCVKKRMRSFARPCPPQILVRKTSLPPSSVHTGW